MSNTQKNTVRIYSAGGCGVNISHLLEPARNSEMVGFAKYELCYIDTSKSNMLRKKLNDEDVYIFDDMDGSGKIRKENYKAIAANTKAVLQKFKPQTFNIVVHSASGGSGGIIATNLVSELLSAGKEVVVIVIGTFNSVIEVENTTKTLQSYEAVASLREKNVNMVYLQNSIDQNDETAVNSQAMQIISMLLGLFSGEHEQLDTADLKTWLNHNKVTGSDPCINNILIGCGADLAPYHKGEHFTIRDPITVATLATRDMNTKYNHVPVVKFEGYVPAEWKAGDKNGLTSIQNEPIHFCVMEDKMSDIFKFLTTHLKGLKEKDNSRVRRASILSDTETTDGGIVL